MFGKLPSDKYITMNLSKNLEERCQYMVRCPKCGAEVEKPVKTWQLAPKGRKPVTIGLFKCPNCGAYFRKGVKE